EVRLVGGTGVVERRVDVDVGGGRAAVGAFQRAGERGSVVRTVDGAIERVVDLRVDGDDVAALEVDEHLVADRILAAHTLDDLFVRLVDCAILGLEVDHPGSRDGTARHGGPAGVIDDG